MPDGLHSTNVPLLGQFSRATEHDRLTQECARSAGERDTSSGLTATKQLVAGAIGQQVQHHAIGVAACNVRI